MVSTYALGGLDADGDHILFGMLDDLDSLKVLDGLELLDSLDINEDHVLLGVHDNLDGFNRLVLGTYLMVLVSKSVSYHGLEVLDGFEALDGLQVLNWSQGIQRS